jgi:hypothetical protein
MWILSNSLTGSGFAINVSSNLTSIVYVAKVNEFISLGAIKSLYEIC